MLSAAEAPPVTGSAMMKRVLKRGWAVCLCAASSNAGSSTGSLGFITFASPQFFRGEKNSHGREAPQCTFTREDPVCLRRRTTEACSMSFSIPATTRTQRRRRGSSSFLTQKVDLRKRKPTKAGRLQQADEVMLGHKIQEGLRLTEIRTALSTRLGCEPSGEQWAEAVGEPLAVIEKKVKEGEVARQTMVVLNLGLVRSIVSAYTSASREMGGAHFTTLDLVQEATLGLIRATEKYNPHMNNRFSTYASWWIRKLLNQALQTQNRIIRIPSYLADRISKVKRLTSELTFELGRPPTISEVAEEAGLSVAQIRSCRESNINITSLDAMMGSGYWGSDGLGVLAEEGVASVDPGVEEAITLARGGIGGTGSLTEVMSLSTGGRGAEELQRGLQADLQAALRRLLSQRERACIGMRYGLGDGVSRTYEEIAKAMKTTATEAKVVCRQSLAKLRKGCVPKETENLRAYLSAYPSEKKRFYPAEEKWLYPSKEKTLEDRAQESRIAGLEKLLEPEDFKYMEGLGMGEP